MNQSHRHRPLSDGARVDSCLVEGVLGRGGFGITYAVYDESEDARYALKEFFPDGLVYRLDFLSPDDEVLNPLCKVLVGLPDGLFDLFKDARLFRRLLISK